MARDDRDVDHHKRPIDISTPTERLLGHILSNQEHQHECIHRLDIAVRSLNAQVDAFKAIKNQVIGASFVASGMVACVGWFFSTVILK